MIEVHPLFARFLKFPGSLPVITPRKQLDRGTLFIMSNRLDVVITLRKQLKEVQLTVARLGEAIRVLEGLGRSSGRRARTISAAGRRRIAAAQRKRWARLRLIKKR